MKPATASPPAIAAALAALALSGCTLHVASGTGGSSPPTPASTPAASHPAAPATQAVPAPSGGTIQAVHDPGTVTGSYPRHCTAWDGGTMPDPRCDPGAIDPAVNQADIQSTICRSGYTATVRPPESATERFKWDTAVPGYGLPQSFHGELDHLVPLELGGANDAANLWPEAGSLPNRKDSAEGALRRAVCDGRVTLAAAQRAIAASWKTAERRLGISK